MIRRLTLCRKKEEEGYEGNSLAENSGSGFGRKNEKLDILNCVVIGSLLIFNKQMLIMLYLNEFSEKTLEAVKVFELIQGDQCSIKCLRYGGM